MKIPYNICAVSVIAAMTLLSCPARLEAQETTAEILSSEYVYEPGSFPSCHASTIVRTKEGELLCAFFGGAYEGNPDVCIWLCRKSGSDDGRIQSDASDDSAKNSVVGEETTLKPAESAWSIPVKVADGIIDGVKTACYNPVLYQIPHGDLLLFYKVGENVQAWNGYVIRSEDGGKTWSNPVRLPEGFLGPVRNKPVKIGGELVCGSSLEKGGWRVFVERIRIKNLLKKDSPWAEGIWSKTEDLNEKEGPLQLIQPTFLQIKDTLVMLCRSREAGTPIMRSWSADKGRTWSEFEPTNLKSNNSGIDGVTVDGTHFLVYNDAPEERPSSRERLVLAVSKDTRTWTNLLTLEDTPDSEFSYPAIIKSSKDNLEIVYTWNRKKIKHVTVSSK